MARLRDALGAGRLALIAPLLEGWQRECLDRMGVAGALREAAGPIVRVRDLIVPSFFDTRDVETPSRAARDTFAALAPRMAAAAGAPSRLYISRRGMVQRPMTNERDLEAALAALGFVTIRPETLSIDGQASAFAAARAIVGVNGSAMANIGFARPGCVIAEIMPSGFQGPWIRRLAAILGHVHVEIPVDTPGEAIDVNEHGGKRFRPGWSFAVDVGEVVAGVQAALALSQPPPAAA